MNEGFGAVNYIVLILYLSAVFYIAIRSSKMASNDTNSFFRAGGKMPSWAVGMSIFATAISSIGFMSKPSKAFADDSAFFFAIIANVALIPILVKYIIPVYRKLDITTAYEYLEERFNYITRVFGSLSFMAFHLGRIAIVTYLPVLAITSVTDIDPYLAVTLIGIICIAYTYIGGMEGVIWTDAVQGIVLLAGVSFAVLFALMSMDGGLNTVIQTGLEHDKWITTKHLELSLTEDNIWILFGGAFFTGLYTYIGSQDVVQRYNTTKSIDDTKKSLYWNGSMIVVLNVMLFFFGVAIFTYYQINPDQYVEGVKKDAIVPFFVIRELPMGISGIIIAAIFAASQSTVSSSLNSISACYVVDFKKRLNPNLTEKVYVKSAGRMILVAGIIGMLMTYYLVATNQRDLLNFWLSISGLFGGPISGVFILGLFTKKANGKGVVYGLVVSVVCFYLFKQLSGFHGILNGFFGMSFAIIFGYLFSLFFATDDQKYTNQNGSK